MKRFSLLFPYMLLTAVVASIIASNWPRQTIERVTQAPLVHECAPCGMEVDPEIALTATVDGRVQYFCGPGCRTRALQEGITKPQAQANASDRLVDVVCHMEVNAGWGIESEHDGKTYYFCTQRCKERFDQDAAAFLVAKCVVCKARLTESTFDATYLDRTYRLCTAEHRAAFKSDPAAYFMHSMWGIPTWLYYVSIAVVLVLSFGVFEWLGRRSESRAEASESKQRVAQHIGSDQIRGEGERLVGSIRGNSYNTGYSLALPILPLASLLAPPMSATTRAVATDRFDLLGVRWIRAALGSRVFRFVLQAIVAVLFLAIIAAGLFGNQNPALNIAPTLTWTVWWGFLIILILFAGKSWCYVCPWDALAGWTEKLSFWKKSSDGLSLGWKWPRVVRNISIATIMFVGLTWIELGFGVTMKPRITAYLAIGMLLMAVVSALLFDRKSFCRYGCLVGRVSGLYALFSSVEVRARDAETCTRCHTKECVKGSETAYGCPTFLYPGKLQENTYCIQCMECVQACPHDNLAVNLRPWGADLAKEVKPRADEAYLALLMLAITGFHGLTMTPAWEQLIAGLRNATGVGRVIGFSIGMLLLMVSPILIYALLVGFSKKLGATKALQPLTYRDYFIRYAYALLPIALFYHIAHNLEHLLMEGPKVVAMVSDPMGWGWNIFGTASWTMPPMISLSHLWIVQAILVLVGHVYSLWVAQKTSLRLFGSTRAAFRSQIPMLVGMICFSVFSLWLLKQPMEMRTSAM